MSSILCLTSGSAEEDAAGSSWQAATPDGTDRAGKLDPEVEWGET